MRIRKRWVALLLLMSSLPHLLADDSSPLIEEEDGAVNYNGDDVDIVPPDLLQQHESTEQPVDDNQVDHEEEATSSPQTQQQQQQKMKPITRPQHEKDTAEVWQSDDHLASSRDYEDPKFDGDETTTTTTTTEEENAIYHSSLATDDEEDDETDAIDTVDTEHDADNQSESVNDSESDQIRSTEADAREPIPEDGEESASQSIHEDGFRLPSLHKLEIVNDKSSDVENENIDGAEEHLGDTATSPESEIIETDLDDEADSTEEGGEEHQETESTANFDADDGSVESFHQDGIQLSDLHVETDPQVEDSSMHESEIIKHTADDDNHDGNFSAVDESVSDIEPLVEVENDDNGGVHENTREDGQNHAEKNEMTKVELDEVVIEEDNSGSFGSIGTTNTEEIEVEDEDVVILNDAKMAIGTTSIESMVADDVDSNDIKIIESEVEATDTELLEKVDDESESQHNLGDDSFPGQEEDENDGEMEEDATKETLVDETDLNIIDEAIDVVDDITNSADLATEVKDLREKNNIQPNTSVENDVDDEDNRESSDDTEDVDDASEEEEQEIEDDDDEDEDLTDRVSVDYASKSAGALIIEKTSEFKGTSNLITGDRDKYAIVPCSEEKKQVVLSLSEGILVKEIKLANYERFSSTVKDFQVKGSHTLGQWETLGTFKAKAGNGEQTFVLDNPAWARYLKFRFLTHHGAEYYCTLSQIKVHGSNMVQGFHEEWQNIEDENNEIQIEESQSETVGETPNTEDSGKNDESESTESIIHSVNADENLTSSTSAAEADSYSLNRTSDVHEIEKGDSGPRDAQVTPSVRSKPKSLDDFRSPANFYEIIQGEIIADEQLFANLFDLIPDAMSNLPAHSKRDICTAEESELRSVHQIGRLAIESLYSIGSRIVDDIANIVSEPNEIIVSPKMNELLTDYYQKRFGSGLLSMINLSNDDANDQTTTEAKSSEDTITDGKTEGTGESSSIKQTDEANEESLGQIAKTVSSNKEQISPPAMNDSIVGSNDSLDLTLLQLLKDLPSAECLVNLDFAEFKKKVSAARKSSGAAGSSPGGRMMEPIFKKLTDEIFALQTSLSVHDQFSKMSVGCYQRVILDLALETERLRRDQDDRLRRLEEQILEPASMRMFIKFIVALVSTVTTWCVSNGLQLFKTLKDNWIPTILRYLLSKDTYEGVRSAYYSVQVLSKDTFEGLRNAYYFVKGYSGQAYQIFHVLLGHLGRGIEILFDTLESKEWAKRETYQEFLSAWSAYYDGGMLVVVTVLILLICKLLMLCSSFRKRNNKKSSVRNASKQLPSPQTEKAISQSTSDAFPDDRLSAPVASKKGKKKSRRKNKNKPSQPVNSVPVVEDIDQKPSDESIPDLQDETHRESSTVSTTGMRDSPTGHFPSVVSLEEEE